MERTGSKSRSIPFSNPAAAARALPACHKCVRFDNGFKSMTVKLPFLYARRKFEAKIIVEPGRPEFTPGSDTINRYKS